jgi:uncharacterized MAPEG superfamily protein
MQVLLMPYHSSVLGLLALAVLAVIQFGVADIAGIRAKHVPGMPVAGGHDSFLFRATRAHANTYENLGLFLLLVLICLFAGASPRWTAICIWLFVAARVAYMGCYYADLRFARSTAFAVGALAQLGLLVGGFAAVWSA